MTRRFVVSLLCGWIVVAATASASAAPREPRPRCATPMPQEPTPLGVAVELELSKTTLQRGEPLGLEVTVRNNGVLPVSYTHSGQIHDFWIRDERGTVWLWSQKTGAVFTQPFVRDYLMPGETKTARARWTTLCSPDGRGDRPGLPGPGRYVARALWVSDIDDEDGDGHGSWWSDEVPFRIRPAKKG